VFRASREVFSERGYEGTTLASIAARLELSPAALLRHAPTKDALFRESMAASETEPAFPAEFLEDLPADADPAEVLARLARTLVPFIERKMGETIACFWKARGSRARTFRLPFDPRQRSSPPARALAALEAYFRRARAAGRVRVSDPRAAALVFLGAIQSYVFMHRVARITPAVPLERYLSTLLGIWDKGAFRREPRSGRKPR